MEVLPFVAMAAIEPMISKQNRTCNLRPEVLQLVGNRMISNEVRFLLDDFLLEVLCFGDGLLGDVLLIILWSLISLLLGWPAAGALGGSAFLLSTIDSSGLASALRGGLDGSAFTLSGRSSTWHGVTILDSSNLALVLVFD